jgi:hypothetical protein
MVTPPAILAEIPIVPLPPAPIRPVGRQDVGSPLLAGAPWLGAGLLAALAILVLIKLRTGQSTERAPSGWTPWSSGPQVQPVRDPKYWSLIVQAEKDSQRTQPDVGAERPQPAKESSKDSTLFD